MIKTGHHPAEIKLFSVTIDLSEGIELKSVEVNLLDLKVEFGTMLSYFPCLHNVLIY